MHHAAAQGVVAGADLVLVDVHPHPAEALCDGPQALTLEELPHFLEDMARVRLLYETRVGAAALDIPEPHALLSAAREGIEAVDAELLALLARRATLGAAAGQAKRALGAPVRDPGREEHNRAVRRALAEARGLDPRFVDELFDRIVSWSVALQQGRDP